MKSQAEKEHIKKLKKEAKAFENRYRQDNVQFSKKENVARQERILTGILPSEILMDDCVEVYADYLYVVDDGGGKVIRSDVFGCVLDLKRDLRRLGYTAENIYYCHMGKRNLF